jgi:hypothetical protein
MYEGKVIMKKSVKISIGILIFIIAITLCILCCILAFSVGGITYFVKSENNSTTPEVIVETNKEPLPIGSEVNYYQQTVKLIEYEFSGSYKIKYENIYQNPPERAKYLWIYIIARNDGNKSIFNPSKIEFTLIYQGKQIDPEIIYSPRSGYNDFGRGAILPGRSREGWLLFTVPDAAVASQIIVMFKPYLEYSDIYFLWKLVP